MARTSSPLLTRNRKSNFHSPGRGSGIVVATGSQTEFGVIFSMMQDVEERRTPLHRNMDELAQKLSIMSFEIIGIICLIGIFQNRPWLDMFTIGGSPSIADSGRWAYLRS